MPSATSWIESLSPWPEDGFGLDRMRGLLAALGDPQLAFPAVHVVGTNGKGTTTRTIEETPDPGGAPGRRLLLAACNKLARTDQGPRRRGRLRARRRRDPAPGGGCRCDPVRGPDRRRTAGVRRRRRRCRGRRGRPRRPLRRDERASHDAGRRAHECRARAQGGTRLHARGDRRGRSSRSCQPGSTVILGEAEWESLALARRPGSCKLLQVATRAGGRGGLGVPGAGGGAGGGRAAGSARVPRRRDPRRRSHSGGSAYIAPKLPPVGAIVASVLRTRMSTAYSASCPGSRLRWLRRIVAPRVAPAEALARRAEAFFETVETAPDPTVAVARAHELGSPVLVTGSLYLLADLSKREEQSVPCRNLVNG